ncbi:MAG: HAMP domain-containing protein [Dethiobacter sp.]|jgi:signal transduction histidine kinase|nr:HAMP domain-containing protein [Dethiobacter sp.]MBS3897400.1 HAMP domain-containing protein [Dethiobacter sp.]MBS3983215.1 HAMP domain-containing protein [Dethiobacter sp.]MCL4463135.1 cell wall metabolism sensor histidine kinase WalK [Bacillota bacterium]MCL5994225.1 cell wall metabolism sensor histidine kinase WalK [Bacillota bacterium]
MFNSIRTKLTVTYIVLILAVLLVTSFFLLNTLEQYYISYQYLILEAAAHPVAREAVANLREVPNVVTLSNVAEEYGRQYRIRVLITDHRQRVQGDSLRVGGLVGTTLERAEITAALAGEQGRSIQYSHESRQWVMQVAVPIIFEESIIGAVFIASSLSDVYAVLDNVREFLLLATVLSLLFAGLLGVYFAHHITVPIESLTAATEQIARGDLTQRVSVRSKDEIGRLAGQFNHMAGRLQEMTRQLREFVSNASHEMRTPLTSLNILVKSLREYPLEAEEREDFLADIDQEVERLIHLVESLLDLTRLDRLGAEDTMSRTDIVPTVRNTLEMLKKRAEEKSIALEYSLPESTEPVFAVLHQVKQVVFNLLDNAIKYTPEGGHVQVGLFQEPERLLLSVTDSGIGIPPEHREKIFERFYRVDKARSREQGGTGLGLAIVKEIVTRHGGEILVEDNENGLGTTFIVTWPSAVGVAAAGEY